MSSFLDVEGHLTYQLRNATVKKWPFPHFYVENVFPDDFYHFLIEKLDKKHDFQAVEGRYAGRTFADLTDFTELAFMQQHDFLRNVTRIFASDMNKRFEGRDQKHCGIFNDLRLIRDHVNYQIGPHTDAAWKLVSLLFYLPPDAVHYQHGTSIYTPKDPAFRCPGGPHHDFAGFNRIYTAPYYPNSCFGFFKTDNSFHGVEAIKTDFKRDVLLYNIYDEQLYLKMHKPKEQGKEQPS